MMGVLMPSKFLPSYVRADGTFCVVAKFKTSEDASSLREPVTEYCEQWVVENRHWKRTDSEINIEKNGPWDYFAIFFGAPYVIKAEDHQLWLRLDARLYSYWWRDWFASMMGNLVRAFPVLQPEEKLFFDCDE
jgi:hypothetical protein